jgi:hypothetical protein
LVGAGIAIGTALSARHLETQVAAAIFFIFYVPFTIRLAMAAIFSSDQGVRVVNVFSTFELHWSEIDHFDIGQSGILPAVCRIHLRSGDRKHAFGIQESTNFPNGSAQALVDQLSAELISQRDEWPRL